MKRPILIALAGLLVIGIAIGMSVWNKRHDEQPDSQVSSESTGAPPVPAAPKEAAEPAPVAPSFDVVRVGPQGETVIAGRADPGPRWKSSTAAKRSAV